MPNVKPGDFARVTKDQYFPENVGKQVIVAKEWTLPSGSRGYDWTAAVLGKIWVCEALQPFRAYSHGGFDKEVHSKTINPGQLIAIPDKNLVRIDPPADTNHVFGHEPLPGERLFEELQLPAHVRHSKELES